MAITSLTNKKCLITGAASGIGRALARAAAREGAELYLTDINQEALEGLAATIRAGGGNVALARAFDISDYDRLRAFADEIHGREASLDVLMNVAGISIWGTVENLEHEHWRKCIDINLMGPIHVIECFIPQMISAGRGGHLVNVSSAAGLFGLPWHGAYSASKFGLRGVSEVLRFDLKRHGIGVSLVCPGGVNTGLVRTVDIRGVDREDRRIKKLVQRFRRHAVSPEQAAEAILKGMKANDYLVFTSPDIRIGHWFQQKFTPAYEFAMEVMNRYLTSAAFAAGGESAKATQGAAVSMHRKPRS